jgi:hypothetical protein
MFDLAESLRQHEGKPLKFRRDLSPPEEVKRSLAAYANCAGGWLFIMES